MPLVISQRWLPAVSIIVASEQIFESAGEGPETAAGEAGGPKTIAEPVDVDTPEFPLEPGPLLAGQATSSTHLSAQANCLGPMALLKSANSAKSGGLVRLPQGFLPL